MLDNIRHSLNPLKAGPGGAVVHLPHYKCNTANLAVRLGNGWLGFSSRPRTVSVTLKYGYYGNRHLVLGPSSSRLLEASSVFVKQIQVRDEYEKGVSLYGFSEMPELSLENNWSVSTYVIVTSYGRKGFALWLNKGSSLRIRWEAQTSCLGQLEVSIIKGREAEYAIEEDDKYCLRIVNANPRSIIMVVNVNVSSKIYDTTTAESMCSTTNGSCRLDLLFPNTQFVAVTTPNNGELGEWYIELAFVARVVTYIAILGFVIIIIFLILKFLGACDGDHTPEEETQARQVTEADPLIPVKPFRLPYGTGDEDDLESGSSSSSEDLYDGKICVICYEEPRNCFFVPCGHCATCYTCAQRPTLESTTVIQTGHPRSIIMVVSVNISSKIYGTAKAESMCSTTNGLCRPDLLFPDAQFVAVSTPNNVSLNVLGNAKTVIVKFQYVQGGLGKWNIALSFVARVVTYTAILGTLLSTLLPLSTPLELLLPNLFMVSSGSATIIVFLILNYLGACDGDPTREEETQARQVTEADPLMPEKPFRLPYGTGDEDDLESGSSSSSEDLYDGIVDGNTKVCPICRRLIHKVRKLLIP
ncbi:hypothetical protein RHMOL_Rhmol07G0286700 [Rhododendron molle]|uniref:Uncharacterized protein n=1 Tax=Rhododendron molle TaxID=49168 RepID=A0ACC0N7A9_RHOML|nr:hypothetical protein RHMOL_Rhmol07G0286700 [Rhododendron molle]